MDYEGYFACDEAQYSRKMRSRRLTKILPDKGRRGGDGVNHSSVGTKRHNCPPQGWRAASQPPESEFDSMNVKTM